MYRTQGLDYQRRRSYSAAPSSSFGPSYDEVYQPCPSCGRSVNRRDMGTHTQLCSRTPGRVNPPREVQYTPAQYSAPGERWLEKPQYRGPVLGTPSYAKYDVNGGWRTAVLGGGDQAFRADSAPKAPVYDLADEEFEKFVRKQSRRSRSEGPRKEPKKTKKATKQPQEPQEVWPEEDITSAYVLKNRVSRSGLRPWEVQREQNGAWESPRRAEFEDKSQSQENRTPSRGISKDYRARMLVTEDYDDTVRRARSRSGSKRPKKTTQREPSSAYSTERSPAKNPPPMSQPRDPSPSKKVNSSVRESPKRSNRSPSAVYKSPQKARSKEQRTKARGRSPGSFKFAHQEGIEQMRQDRLMGGGSKEPELVLKPDQQGPRKKSEKLRWNCPHCQIVLPMNQLEEHTKICRQKALQKSKLESYDYDMGPAPEQDEPWEDIPDSSRDPPEPRTVSPEPVAANVRTQATIQKIPTQAPSWNVASRRRSVSPSMSISTQTETQTEPPLFEYSHPTMSAHATQTSFRQMPPASDGYNPMSRASLPPQPPGPLSRAALPPPGPSRPPRAPPYGRPESTSPTAYYTPPPAAPIKNALPDLEALIQFVDRVRSSTPQTREATPEPEDASSRHEDSIQQKSPSPKKGKDPSSSDASKPSGTVTKTVPNTYDTPDESVPIKRKGQSVTVEFTGNDDADDDGAWAMGGGQTFDDSGDMMDTLGMYETSSPKSLVPCSFCNRKFAANRLAKHETICEKIAAKKRDTFDVTAQRVRGMAQPSDASLGDALGGGSGGGSGLKRYQEETVQLDITTRQPDGRYPCPTCGRKFNEDAAIRHFHMCKRITTNDKLRFKFH